MGFEYDRALVRLENVLLELPFDRALPDLEVVLARAEVTHAILRRDDRLLKVLHEAVVARPFGQLDDVRRTRTEIELCTLEVEVLTERLHEPGIPREAFERVSLRVDAVRQRLEQVRGRL